MAALKTIPAFLNSQGGTLVIGVEDSGTACGIGQDLKLAKGSKDAFENLLVTLTTNALGESLAPYYRVRFEPVEDKDVCIVDVERSPEPVFAKTDKGTEFFVRVGNTTHSLDTEETHKYIEMNWD